MERSATAGSTVSLNLTTIGIDSSAPRHVAPRASGPSLTATAPLSSRRLVG